ncbi:MAG: DUF2752 domain-containing protein [Acidobacteriota bacterium]
MAEAPQRAEGHPSVPVLDRAPTPQAEVRGRRQLGFLWGAAVLGIALLAPFAERLALLLPACPLKTSTGVPCPTCGTTRAALLLGDGRVFDALSLYPLPTLLWLVFTVGGLIAAGAAFVGHPLPNPPKRLSWPLRVALVATVAASWIFNVATGV